MLGRNPFTDPEDGPDPTPAIPVTPRLRVTAFDGQEVCIDMEMVDASGKHVFTLNRMRLREGDSVLLSDVDIAVRIIHKERT